MRMFLGLAVLVLAGAVLTSWGAGTPEAEVTFISGAQHNHLDPQRMSWSHDIRLANVLYDTLVVVDYNDFSVRGGAAERWEVSDDGLTYTFHLRPEARWSNGDPVTAHDFEAAWRRAMLPDLAADYSQLMFYIAGARAFFDRRAADLEQFTRLSAGVDDDRREAIAQELWLNARAYFDEMVGIQTPDDKTLIVTLDHRTPFFLDLLAFGTFMPVHRPSIEAHTLVSAASAMVQVEPWYWSQPVTNGPYTIAERRFGQYVHMEANPFYWDRASMRNQSLLEVIVIDPNTAIQKYEVGEADIHLQVPGTGEIARLLTESMDQRDDIVRQPMAGTYFYNFNCHPTLNDGSPNPLHDVRVRRALSLAIDRQSIVSNVTGVGQPVALTYVPPGAVKGYDPPAEHGVTFDPDRARQLLAEAGYPDAAGLTGLSILYNTGANHEATAQAIRRMWKEHLGLTVDLEGMPVKQFSNKLKSGDYTIARASWFGDYPDPTTWLQKMTTEDGNNDCQWSNADFDALVEKSNAMAPGPQRMAALRDAEAILLQEQPMALLYQYVNLYLYDPDRVHGMTPNAWGRWSLEHVSVSDDRGAGASPEGDG